MRAIFAIILAVTMSLVTPHFVLGYGGGGGGVTAESNVDRGDPDNPPPGFETTDLVVDVNMIDTTSVDSSTSTIEPVTVTSAPSSPLTTDDLWGILNQWVVSNPITIIRDSVLNRVPRGESCVDASRDRARDIANHIRDLQARGELELGGHTVTVGSRSGYRYGHGPDTSLHTYTVVQIHDAKGKFVGAFEVDTYVATIVLPHGKVDFEKGLWPEHVQAIPSRKGGTK